MKRRLPTVPDMRAPSLRRRLNTTTKALHITEPQPLLKNGERWLHGAPSFYGCNQTKPPSGLVRHAEVLRGKILCKNTWKTTDKAPMAGILEITNKFNNLRLSDPVRIAYLVKVATASAQKTEELIKQERNKNWRTHVAGTGGEGTRGPTSMQKNP